MWMFRQNDEYGYVNVDQMQNVIWRMIFLLINHWFCQDYNVEMVPLNPLELRISLYGRW